MEGKHMTGASATKDRIAAKDEKRGPLAGLRVLDMTRIMAGPYCTQTLADLGADVIKIERPKTGDDTRYWGPPFLQDSSGHPTTETAYNLAVNRGKQSVTVDFSTAEGGEIIRELAKASDILVENYRTGQLSRYGLGFEQLRSENPGLIYLSITGFGQSGPYKDKPGYDFALQGMAGLMSVTGERDGRPGAGPEKVGVAVADISAGMYGAIAVLAAIVHRQISGQGQHIDLSLFESQIAFMANQNLNYLVSGVSPVRLGNAHPNICPYQCLETADGHVVLTVGNDEQFGRFCSVVGHEEWMSDPRFVSNPARVTNRDVLVPMIADIFKARPTRQWLSLLEEADVPCGPVNTIKDVFDDEHVKARRVRVEIEHPMSGTISTVASPMNFSGTPIKYRDAPPLLGQHTEEVLSGLGYASARIQELRERGVI
jgi:crotonobetainyl-CoA:carnitine CoA-transferase CaiB-like acyl-CoA transferase